MLWSLAWALSFVAVALVTKKEWLPFGLTIAAVIGTAIIGVATVLAYRRFLAETDELRRIFERPIERFSIPRRAVARRKTGGASLRVGEGVALSGAFPSR